MSDVAFLLLAFDNIELLVACMLLCTAVLFFATRKRGFGLADPLHFYYTFTFGSAYGVVAMLALTKMLSSSAIALVAILGALWLCGFLVGERLPLALSSSDDSQSPQWDRTGLMTRRALLLSGILVVAYLAAVGSPFNVESRFEANRGIGFLARLLDPLRLIIAGLLFVAGRNKSWAWRGGATVYIVVLAIASGAKSALIECAYAAWLSSQLSAPRDPGRPARFSIGKYVGYASAAALCVGFVIFLLSFNKQAQDAAASNRTSYIEGAPLAVELFALRVIGNGDMYYSGLPADVFFDQVRVDNPIAQLFGAILGDSVMQSVFSYPLANTEVGRQLWLYWNPGDPIIRGPTSHFDLVAYAYFGPVAGALFCVSLGVGLGVLRRCATRSRELPPWKAALIATFYLRALVSLLSPSIAISYLFDLAFVTIILTINIFPRGTTRVPLTS